MSRLIGPSYYTETDLAGEGFRQLGRNVRIARNCALVGVENISIGDNVRIDGFCTLAASGTGFINIGSFVHIGGYCALLAGDGITMGDFSGLSWGVQIYTRSDDFSGRHLTNPTIPSKYTAVSRGAVIIERHAIVGASSVILPRVVVREGAAVGALSLVTKQLPAWGIYTGNPAKWIRDRSRRLLDLEKELMVDLARQETPLRPMPVGDSSGP